ncbi:MAG TPA: patatin-like phospholipase family protein [Geopsychrobacteraceae bacterium]|nr:patatin-like phospholipase family protein [Geopsychrobacteraceae bacterium]
MKTFISLLLVTTVLLFASDAFAKEVKPSIEKSVGIALGSGGAAGLAHIAMLQVFDDLQIIPDRIAGTSIGAVIGALYAAGLNAAEIHEIFAKFGGSELDALSELVQTDQGLELDKMLLVDFGQGGLLDPDGFLDYLAGKIEARTFEDLVIPLEVVATDYSTGHSIVLKQGDLFSAVKASMAVPGLFPPVQIGKQLLIDGGTSNPLPVDLLVQRHDLTVAVDVTGSREGRIDTQRDWLEMFFNTFEIMQQSIIAVRKENNQPEIYIKPDIRNVRLLHFNRIANIMQQAAPAAKQLRFELIKQLGLTKNVDGALP